MALPEPSFNDDETSFAYVTARERWPKILRGAIDDINSHVQSHPEASKCGASVIVKFEKLLDDFKTDSVVRPFLEANIKLKPELALYNADLKDFEAKKQVTWLTGPWLYLECYLYQLIDLQFQETVHLRNFDVFEKLKNQTFRQSSSGVLELCKRYQSLSESLKTDNADQQALKLLFREFVDISLWGNATDLSLLAGKVTLEDIKSLQGAEVRKKNEEKILINDIEKVWLHLINSKRDRIDFVLDNSGFELFADLCLALFALDSGLIKRVVLHCKDIPWFVSDTMLKDFDALVEQLTNQRFFPDFHSYKGDSQAVEHFVESLKNYISTGQISAQAHSFWTSSSNFWKIPIDSDLYEELKKSNLIIFKGDLNYRKLTGDLKWDKTAKFTEAIQDLASSRLPILALRTCKADVVVGLPKGVNEKLIETYRAMGNEQGQFWTSSGKWAVISFADGVHL